MLNSTPQATKLLTTLTVAWLLAGCGAARAPLSVSMAPVALASAAPTVLEKNHFSQDSMGNVSEDAMREILRAPVFLEAGARIGIVPVATGYELDEGVPLTEVTGKLADELGRSGLFEVVSEVTTDWPGTRSIAGLRELATRYRAEYLLLYRHRFVDRSYTNAWGWANLTLLGGLFVPSQTLESAGVLEATFFDVRTGTLLFTSFERVRQEQDANVWHNELKVRRMQEKLLADATRRLSDQVQAQVRRLVAARPKHKDESAPAVALTEPTASLAP